MNTFLNAAKEKQNYTLTQNGGVTHASTLNPVLDLFALGGAYRNRTDEQKWNLFYKAYEADKELALKCLFYLRDVRGGQGERNFFRVVFGRLASSGIASKTIIKNFDNVVKFGRWDDLIYTLADTPLCGEMMDYIEIQLAKDITSDRQGCAVSLLGKWMPSENASSQTTKKMATKLRKYIGLTSRQYRKILSRLRERLKVVERLMSAGRWDEIEFDKIPSKAGLIYRNAFARRDMIAQKYEAFIKNETTKVNAATLYPYEIAGHAWDYRHEPYTNVERVALNKYWENQKDWLDGKTDGGIAVVDTSGSMTCGGRIYRPIDVATSLGLYLAERNKGPFHNHFFTFSDNPDLVEIHGIDITDKIVNMYAEHQDDWEGTTNIEAVFNEMLMLAQQYSVKPEDVPSVVYIISDMEFNGTITSNANATGNRWSGYGYEREDEVNTVIEEQAIKWKKAGYKIPRVIFWNVNAMSDNIPAIGEGFSYVSGFSPSIMEAILSGKDGVDLMLEKLNSERYESVVI